VDWLGLSTITPDGPWYGHPPSQAAPPCATRAWHIAEAATGATDSIRHCVAVCELKRCYGRLGGWIGTYANYWFDVLSQSGDFMEDFDSGNDGALIPQPSCEEDNDDYCTDKCRKKGW